MVHMTLPRCAPSHHTLPTMHGLQPLCLPPEHGLWADALRRLDEIACPRCCLTGVPGAQQQSCTRCCLTGVPGAQQQSCTRYCLTGVPGAQQQSCTRCCFTGVPGAQQSCRVMDIQCVPSIIMRHYRQNNNNNNNNTVLRNSNAAHPL